MRKPIHWKCLGCHRHLSTIEDMRVSFAQTAKCSSCKAVNKIIIEDDGKSIKCETLYSGEPVQKKIG